MVHVFVFVFLSKKQYRHIVAESKSKNLRIFNLVAVAQATTTVSSFSGLMVCAPVPSSTREVIKESRVQGQLPLPLIWSPVWDTQKLVSKPRLCKALFLFLNFLPNTRSEFYLLISNICCLLYPSP